MPLQSGSSTVAYMVDHYSLHHRTWNASSHDVFQAQSGSGVEAIVERGVRSVGSGKLKSNALWYLLLPLLPPELQLYHPRAGS